MTNKESYCDPPYFETSGYRYGMELEDYRRLAEILGAIAGRFILTINDHPVMREVFGGFAFEKVEVSYSVARKIEARGKYGELVVTG